MKNGSTRNLIFTALLVAVGVVLPRLVHLIPRAGNVLLPMHYPVFIAGLLLGARYGLAVGILSPLLSSVTTGSPVLFPKGLAMMGELATYGVISGLLVKSLNFLKIKNGGLGAVICYALSLLISMLAGRAVLGAINFLIVQGYTLEAFLASAFVSALPGIAIQLVTLPLLAIPLKNLFSGSLARAEVQDD